MSGGSKISENTVKRSISLSPTVNEWAEEMAERRGQQNNFSAFIADVIREARNKESAALKEAQLPPVQQPASDDGKYPSLRRHTLPGGGKKRRAKTPTSSDAVRALLSTAHLPAAADTAHKGHA